MRTEKELLMNSAVVDVEQLLAHFLIGVLGLTLQSEIRGGRRDQPMRSQGERAPTNGADMPVCADWQTDQGIVSIAGTYDHSQSQRTYAHVLLLSWWIPPHTHHEAWWRCDIRRPREWTRGRGG